MYDFIIVGGGVAGSATAYHLSLKNKKVLLLEKNSLCSGGSYAAGAFISPKIGLKSEYNDFVNEALNFSLNFYEKNFKKELSKTALLKIPKNEDDLKKLKSYEPFMPPFSKLSSKELDFLKSESASLGAYKFENAAILEIDGICQKLTKEIDVVENYEVKEIKYQDEIYKIGKYQAKNLIISTGVERVLDLKYIDIRKLCGYRFDVETNTKVNYNISKDVAISTSKDNIVKIGATHLRGDDCFEKMVVDDTLFKKAKEIIDLKDAKIIKTYKAIRSASIDFFPILGEIIDTKKSLEKYPYIIHGSKVPPNLLFRKKIYIHNGLGARGFVLAPFTAKLLVESILEDKPLNPKIENSRLFYKWARKIKS